MKVKGQKNIYESGEKAILKNNKKDDKYKKIQTIHTKNFIWEEKVETL